VAIADQTAGPQQTITQLFSSISSPAPSLGCPLVPQFSDSLDQILAELNAELLQAPSSPESPVNCLLLLLTYDPTNPNATPNPLTPSTELSPAQSLIFGDLLSTYVIEMKSASSSPKFDQSGGLKSDGGLACIGALGIIAVLAVAALALAGGLAAVKKWLDRLDVQGGE
jgi:hypothetical protein